MKIMRLAAVAAMMLALMLVSVQTTPVIIVQDGGDVIQTPEQSVDPVIMVQDGGDAIRAPEQSPEPMTLA